jgi:hypothetical protein
VIKFRKGHEVRRRVGRRRRIHVPARRSLGDKILLSYDDMRYYGVLLSKWVVNSHWKHAEVDEERGDR